MYALYMQTGINHQMHTISNRTKDYYNSFIYLFLRKINITTH